MKDNCSLIFSFNFYYLLISALQCIFYFALVYMLVCLAVYKLNFVPIYYQTIFDRGLDIFCFLKVVRLQNFKWFTKQSMKRVLIVTSHPDDECMFFGPVILSIQKTVSKIYLLCLSQGNHDKQVSKTDFVNEHFIFFIVL